jgi:hypothetical protein
MAASEVCGSTPVHVTAAPRPLRRMLLCLPLPLLLSGCASSESMNTSPVPANGDVPPTGAPATASPATSSPATASPAAPAPAGPTGRMLKAGPADYLAVLRTLGPGDTLELSPGTYDNPAQVPGLPIFNLNGTATRPITITGPQDGPRPLFLGRSTHNTVRLSNASFVIVRNLEVDGRNLGGAGVASQGATHDITIEGLVIRGVGGNQQIVGISTVSHSTWNWTIRRNTIIGAGTGIYLGNSDGTSPFVAGLIENNLIRDSIGYNMQVKHQIPRPTDVGLPTGRSVTVIRHNVFSKGATSSTGGLARPNLLVGAFPSTGPGAEDLYEIYGNFFWQNPVEALFQGEGNVAFYANILVNDTGNAVAIQPHNGVPRTIRVFGNTVIARGSGISLRGGDPAHTQQVLANAVFAGTPLTGGQQSANVVGTYDSAAAHLAAPVQTLEGFDAYPRPGALAQGAFDASALATFTAFDRDFDGRQRQWSIRGAYGSDSVAAVWSLRLGVKP